MATNKRVFWAVEAVGFAQDGTTSYTEVHGLQSAGLTTNFNLEQVFELGQISVYEDIEGIPDVEITLEKVLDGYPLLYHLATRGASAGTLVGRSNQKCIVAMNVYPDTYNSASGTPLCEFVASGLYLSSVNYTFPVDGNCTESVTLVGNNFEVKTSSFVFTPTYDNSDQPQAITGSGGVQRRENIVFDGSNDATQITILPQDIYGITTSGTNEKDANNQYGAHIQSITISADLGRDPINELGRKAPYHRYVTFPVEVTCDIEVMMTDRAFINVAEESDNLTARTIRVVAEDGTNISLGDSNKLTSVSYGGGDAGGDNATVTYSYRTFNTLDITHPADPG